CPADSSSGGWSATAWSCSAQPESRTPQEIPMAGGNFAVAAIVLVLAIVFVTRALRIVPHQHAWIVERLGKYDRTLGPGLNFVIPFVDRVAYKHSLKEIPLDVPSQVCITKDNTQLTVDGVLYFQVTDPMRASY